MSKTLNIYFLTFFCLILNLQGCKQVTLVLTQDLLDTILLFCKDLNIILHKEEITIGLMKKIDSLFW